VVLNTITLTLHSYSRHEAERLEQEAKGRLERQKISDEAEAEKARKELLELQANSAAVESTGQAKAEAQSRAEAARIEGEAAVDQAKLKSQAMKIEAVSICY
jgi:major vault protein